MAYQEICSVEDGQGNQCQVRWDEETRIVEMRVFYYPDKGEPRWKWMKVGIARSEDLAIMTAVNWMRGE